MKTIILICVLLFSTSSFSQVATGRLQSYSRKKADSLQRIIDLDAEKIDAAHKNRSLHEGVNTITYYTDSVRKLEKIEVYTGQDSSLVTKYFFKKGVMFKISKVKHDVQGMVDFYHCYLDKGVVFLQRRSGDIEIGNDKSALIKRGYLYLGKFKSN